MLTINDAENLLNSFTISYDIQNKIILLQCNMKLSDLLLSIFIVIVFIGLYVANILAKDGNTFV